MHVLIIHQAFAGPADPGGTRHYELAKHLVGAGHRVTIIASEVSYLTGEKLGVGTSVEDGVTVIRVPVQGDHHRSYVRRAFNFASFSVGALRAAVGVPDVDVVWGTTPPLPQLLPAWLASIRCRGRFLLEERDLWPEFAIDMGVIENGVLAKAALRFKKMMYRAATRIVINSPGFLPFLEGYGVDPAKIEVIPNGVDVSQFDPDMDASAARREWDLGDRFVVLYAGALGPANGLEVVLDAAAELRGSRALFVLAGDGKARAELAESARARGLDNVRFLGALPKSRVPELIAASDACLATLRDIPLFRTTYPNKVFDYMAGGRPVILGIDGVIREVVEQADAGTFVPPGDAAALASAVRAMMADPRGAREMGRRGHAAVRERFDRRSQGEQLERLLYVITSPFHRSAPRSATISATTSATSSAPTSATTSGARS